LLTGPEKKPDGEVAEALRAGQPEDPVHGTDAVYEKKIASAICRMTSTSLSISPPSTTPIQGDVRRLGGLP
jgi:hypothetical protein